MGENNHKILVKKRIKHTLLNVESLVHFCFKIIIILVIIIFILILIRSVEFGLINAIHTKLHLAHFNIQVIILLSTKIYKEKKTATSSFISV